MPRADLERVEKRMRRVETAVREADEQRWTRTNPEVAARARSLVDQLEASVASIEADLAKAEAKGDAKAAEAARGAAGRPAGVAGAGPRRARRVRRLTPTRRAEDAPDVRPATPPDASTHEEDELAHGTPWIADVRRPTGTPGDDASSCSPLVAASLAWRGWVVASERRGPFVPLAGHVVRRHPHGHRDDDRGDGAGACAQVTDEAEDACATYRVTAESARGDRRSGSRRDGGRRPQIWVPDSTAARRAGRDGLRWPRPRCARRWRATPVVLAVPDGQQAPDPATWGVGHRRREHAAARPEHLDRRAASR